MTGHGRRTNWRKLVIAMIDCRTYIAFMDNAESPERTELLRSLTATIVSAAVRNTAIEDLSGLIRSVYATLDKLGQPDPVKATLVPAVPVKRSVFPDYIVCLEDGKIFTSLKRHLQSAYNLTPAEYRARWGLPKDYPMVAPNYAQRRSELARTMGLGRKASPSITEDAPQEPPITKIPEVRSGRSKSV